MARRSDHTKEELFELALAAAESLIAEKGLAGLTARALATRIGYTPGTLYTVFHNLDDAILRVNARTLARLHSRMSRAGSEGAPPLARLQKTARAYVAFARDNPNLWRACFEHRLPDGLARPDFLEERIQQLIGLIMPPLEQAMGANGETLDAAAQALWSGVHGICILTLTGKLHTVGGQAVEELTDDLVIHYLTGLAARRDQPGP